MTALALVFNPDDDLLHDTRVSERLKELCNYWVLLSRDDNESVHDDIRHAMEGVNGETLNLTALPADKRKIYLESLLQGKASHLMFLQPGAVVECEPDFLPVNGDKGEQVLHLSPSRDVACWQTTIVPNTAVFWMLDDDSTVVARQQQDVLRNNTVRVLDHNRFPRRRSLDRDAIQNLLDTYRASPTADAAINIASAFYKLKDYRQAVEWFHEVLAHSTSMELHWLAHYRSAQCYRQRDNGWEDAEVHLALAFDLDPDRMEPLYYLVKHYRESGIYDRASELAEVAAEIAEPVEGVEFEPDIYRFQLVSEYASCCLSLERDARCIEIVNHALRTPFIPEARRRELASMRARAYGRACPVYPVNIHHRNRLLVIIAFRNAGDYLSQCVASIQQQDYPDYRVVLIDDASTDGALMAIGQLDQRFTTIVNDQRMGALHNQLRAIHEHADDDDIIVHLDGDDWLAHEGAFARINDFFNRTRCWLMYGQFENSLGAYGSCEPLVPDGERLLDQLTKMHFPMHIRAYRAGVLSALIKQDPDLDVLKDHDGNFLDAVSDLALMRALIQIAGAEKSRYNEEILYIYNRSNSESHYQTAEAMALQSSQSVAAGGKPPLQRVGSYLPNGVDVHSTAKTATLFLSLDGATPFLIERWTADGHLPNLASLLKKCQETQVRCADGFGNDAFWNGLCTGCTPGETGYFFRLKLNPENYHLEFKEPGLQVTQDYFWTSLSSTSAKMAIIDIPELKHGGQINGMEISEWLPHARSSQLATCPAELQQDLLDRFGDDPLGGSTERNIPRSDEETERDVNLLLQSIEQKTRAANHYLGRGGWDFFAVGYQQAHDAGHQFWHLHDPEHSRYSRRWHENHGDPLLKIYQRIDDGIGELVNKAGNYTNLVIVAGLSMQSKASCNSILDQVLWEIDIHDRRAAGQAYPQKEELDKRRFFSVPHNNLSGAIRINLAGRESRGVVAEGQQYEETIDMLRQRLPQVINLETEEPVVSHIVPIRETYSGQGVNELADLFVVWKRETPIRQVSSPYFEPIKLHVRDMLDTRSGDHTGHASLYSNVESMAGENGIINVEDISAQLVKLINNGRK